MGVNLGQRGLILAGFHQYYTSNHDVESLADDFGTFCSFEKKSVFQENEKVCPLNE